MEKTELLCPFETIREAVFGQKNMKIAKTPEKDPLITISARGSTDINYFMVLALRK